MAGGDVQLVPEPHTISQRFREDLIKSFPRFGLMSSRAEVSENDEFILKSFRSFQKIVEMHVTKFMDLFFTVVGAEKGHFRDQNFGLVAIRKGFHCVLEVGGNCCGSQTLQNRRQAHSSRKPKGLHRSRYLLALDASGL